MPPSITVALPTYNGAPHLETALRGILAQDAPFDLVVSDDRSTDDTLILVRRVAGDRARVEVNSERLGLADNWNRCVALARTPFVSVFHQDDRMGAGHLSAHLAGFAPGVGLVASASDVIDADGRPVPPRVVDPGGLGPADRTFPPGGLLPDLAVANPLRCSAVSLRVEAHRAANGFVRRWRYVVDWDLWIKVARAWCVCWIARPTVSVRWHGASETHTFKAGVADLEETTALLDELVAAHPELALFRPAADRRLARAYLNRAYGAAVSGRKSLCRLSLARALRMRPSLAARIAADPRLAARLALGSVGRDHPRD